MAAHLAGVVAAHTTLPVVGVPLSGGALNGVDALYATVQMPKGIPVATVAIDGSMNAALLVVQMLAITDSGLAGQLGARPRRAGRRTPGLLRARACVLSRAGVGGSAAGPSATQNDPVLGPFGRTSGHGAAADVQCSSSGSVDARPLLSDGQPLLALSSDAPQLSRVSSGALGEV